ncbi:MAG: polysaccharide deacetylase family protein [Acidobacteria bacterium]|nr:polysaccharide deacetylase family protein [Acidobacteriota bacterium]MBS1866075.1 polysaccharide deacetylase family protein [Acidobacteriota bacterium]
MKRAALLSVVLCGIVCASLQAQEKTLQEKLGYPREAKLLIVHADDLGMTHSVNAASIQALENGGINSASLMVPCPWFPEIADYAKSHPDADFGLHLTLTSERVYYRWGPAATRDQVASLVDANGYLHHDWSAETHIDPKDVEKEIRAQVARAMAMGVKPTHLDSHQNRLFQTNKDLFEAILRVGHENHLPVLIPRSWFGEFSFLERTIGPNDIVIDRVVTMEPGLAAEKWNEFYSDALKHLEPGVTEFVIHLAYADNEMKAATRERATWGAEWRQRDFDFFSSAEFQRLLRENGIHLITWREIGRVMRGENKSEK